VITERGATGLGLDPAILGLAFIPVTSGSQSSLRGQDFWDTM